MTILDHVKAEAAVHGLPWQLVYAICLVESSLDPFAHRYEPQYRWLYGDAHTLSTTERHSQMTSWGLMQVMGAVAREYGFSRKWLTELCTIPLGLAYGCLHLAHFKAKYKEWSDVVAAYNAGSPRRTPTGEYVNQDYVTKVFHEWTMIDPTHPVLIAPAGSNSAPRWENLS